MSARKRWEYDTCQVGGDALFLCNRDMAMIRTMGAAGWEFVAFQRFVETRDQSACYVALFKREAE